MPAAPGWTSGYNTGLVLTPGVWYIEFSTAPTGTMRWAFTTNVGVNVAEDKYDANCPAFTSGGISTMITSNTILILNIWKTSTVTSTVYVKATRLFRYIS